MLVRRSVCVASGLVVVLAALVASAAQPFPQARPIRVIAPLAAGSTVDIVARIVSQKLSEPLGQSVVVENIPGAGGTLGTATAARALPDGHTLLLIPGTQVVSPALYRNAGFDIARDFLPIAIVAQAPNVIVVHPSVPVKNVGDLIALARARPGQITYSHTGRGTPTHLFMELLKAMARVNLADVPYKTGTQSMIEVVNGQVFTSFTNLASGLPYIMSGRVKAIAVSSEKRSSALPEVATVAETVPGYDATVWFGFLAPAATPREIVNRLSAEIQRIAQLPDVVERLAQQGLTPDVMGAEPAAARIRVDADKWTKLVRDLGIRPE